MSRVGGSVGRWDRYVTSADAFVLAGALFLVLLGALSLVFREPSVASEVLSQVALVGSVVAGVVLAWVLHGHRLRGSTWVGMVIGTVVGGLVLVPVFLAVFMLGRFLPSPIPNAEGPWGAIFLLLAAVAAFLALPVVRAVGDLVKRAGDRRIAGVRLGALAVILAAVIASMVIGGETAEAGIFMVPVAAAAAVALAGSAWFEDMRSRSPKPPLAP